MITHQYNLNKGTLLDTHGNTTVESNTSFDRKEKGLALYCNGSDAKFELGDIGNVRSLVFWVNLKSTTEQIFEGDPNAHLIHANAGTLTYPDFDNVFVDGVDANTITTGWHLVVVTSTTDVACSDAVLGLNNAAYGNLWCSKISVYDHELTSEEIAKEMSSFLNATPIQKAVEDNLDYPALKPHDLSHLVDSRVGNPDADDADVLATLDLSTWTVYLDASGSGSTITTTASGSGGLRSIDKIEVGKTYKITAKGTANISGDWNIFFGFSTRQNIFTSKPTGVFELYNVITASQTEVYIRIDGALAAGEYVQFDTLTIEEWSGEELIPDEDVGFVANDVSKWTAYGTNTKEQDGDSVKMTYVDNAGGAYVPLNSTNVLFENPVVDGKYQVVVKAKNNGVGTNNLRVYDGVGATVQSDNLTSEYKTYILEFTPKHPTFCNFAGNNMGAGEIIWLEILSVMKITGLVSSYNFISSP